MTTDPGNGQARTGDTVPRQRVGAHAAAKTNRFRRKSVSGPVPLADRRPGTEAGGQVQPRVDGAAGLPGPVPWARDPITVPLPAAATAVAAPAGAAAARSAAASLCALAVVATVVPLAVTQIPDAIAWSLPPRLAAGGPAVVTSLLRASGLAGLAAITARAGSAARFAVVCAVTGFALAPAAGAVAAVTAPTQSTAESGGAILVAALCGAALALLTRRPHVRAMTAVGLLLAAVGLAALDLAGLPAPSGRLLAVLCVPLAGGLAAALTASLRAVGAAGALAGLVILLAGLVAGYLAAGAVQLRALTGATTIPAEHVALVTATGHWALIAAAVTGAVAVALACTGGRRRGREPDDVADGAPVPRAGGMAGHG